MLTSTSEKNGLAALADEDQLIYSVGISTAAQAEMRMAHHSKARQIIATTLDAEGAQFAQQKIKETGLSHQIKVKVEDVAEPLSYNDDYFDFIYARLVLHYLPKQKLIAALSELYRILKPGGRFFVVVRSTDCVEANRGLFDPQTKMTTYTSNGQSYSRYFHTKESIQTHLTFAGFKIESVDTYQEQLCTDFHRTQLSKQIDSLIEVLAVK